MGPNRGPEAYESNFSPEPASAREARRWAWRVLDELGLTELADRVGVLVGELAVNAVLHARTEYCLVMRPLPGRALRLEVHDGFPDPPRQKPSDGADLLTYGRGLALVEGTADRWGVTANPPGKYVWAEVYP